MNRITAEPHAPPLRPRRLFAYYLFVSLLSGITLMMVEMAGIRLLAPVFGDSNYTWSSLIAIILLAAGLGNIIGGIVSDQAGAERALTASLFAASLLVLVLPALSTALHPLVADMPLIRGTMVFTSVLFILPGIAFGVMSTIAFRLFSRLEGDRRVGLSSGLIGSAGLAGSVAGTLMTGMWLMGFLGITQIFALAAALLFATSLLGLIVQSQRLSPAQWAGAGVAAVLAVALNLFGEARPTGNVVFQALSPYQLLRVIDEPVEDGSTVRKMAHDRTYQGSYDLERREPAEIYQRMWRLMELQRPTAPVHSALLIGGGTFGVPQMMSRRWPEAHLSVLEIDPVVIQAARDWFDLDDYPAIEAIAQDGRYYLNHKLALHDVVYLDAYSGLRSIPTHLTTVEFFRTLHERMAPGALGMMNLIGRVQPPGTDLFDAMLATLQSVFADVQVYTTGHTSGDGVTNILLLFGDRLMAHELMEPVDDETAHLVTLHVPTGTAVAHDAQVLSDDFAPVQQLVSRTLIDVGGTLIGTRQGTERKAP